MNALTVTTGRAGFDLMLARIEGLSFDGPDRAGADLELEVAAACARERLSELGAPQVLCARLDVALAIADAQSEQGEAQRAPRLARPLKSHVFDHSREDDLMNFDIAMLLPVWIFGSALGIGVVLLIANAAPKRAAPAARMPPVIRPPIAPTAPLSR